MRTVGAPCVGEHVLSHGFAANRYGREVAGAGDDEFCRICDHSIDCHRDKGRGLASAYDMGRFASPAPVPLVEIQGSYYPVLCWWPCFCGDHPAPARLGY